MYMGLKRTAQSNGDKTAMHCACGKNIPSLYGGKQLWQNETMTIGNFLILSNFR
jgi:hypothetical protein